MGFLNPYNFIFKPPNEIISSVHWSGERGTDSLTILRGRGIADIKSDNTVLLFKICFTD
jgi:hypothetical protein